VEQMEKIDTAASPEIWFRSVCSQSGLGIDDEKIKLLARYGDLLLEWNKKINLISRKDEANIWTAHLLHAVSPLIFLNVSPNAMILDLGTGGGLPGIPLSILRPDLNITLLDSTKKKIDAVSDMVQRLGLANVHTMWGRAEEVALKSEYYHKMDLVIARAVAPLRDLVKWSLPFFGEGLENNSDTLPMPALVTLKGGDLENEVLEIQNHKRIKNIRIIDLILKNLELPELQDKKIVVVEVTKAQS
jgi:16S rRNA (guanine527-N7)-methyltransferase